MRKKITLSIVVLSVLMMSITFGVYAAVKHSLIINGKTINADIKVINGTTYVPLRVITENVESIDLKYDPSNKTITVNDRKEETVTSNEVDTAPINNIGKELTKYELEDLLTRDYSKLSTSLGVIEFNFEVIENDSSVLPYDYWIRTHYPEKFFDDLKDNIKISSSDKDKVVVELKKHMESIASASMKAMPNKKLYGNYYHFFFKYPTLMLDGVTYKYFSWRNYDGNEFVKYTDTSISKFNWFPNLDNKF